MTFIGGFKPVLSYSKPHTSKTYREINIEKKRKIRKLGKKKKKIEVKI